MFIKDDIFGNRSYTADCSWHDGVRQTIVRKNASTLYALVDSQFAPTPGYRLLESTDNGVTWNDIQQIHNLDHIQGGTCMDYDSVNDKLVFGISQSSITTYHSAGYVEYDLGTSTLSSNEDVLPYQWGWFSPPIPIVVGGTTYLVGSGRNSLSDNDWSLKVNRRDGVDTWTEIYDSEVSANLVVDSRSNGSLYFNVFTDGTNIHIIARLDDTTIPGTDYKYYYIWYDGTWHEEVIGIDSYLAYGTTLASISVDSTGKVFVMVSSGFGAFSDSVIAVKDVTWQTPTICPNGISEAILCMTNTDDLYIVCTSSLYQPYTERKRINYTRYHYPSDTFAGLAVIHNDPTGYFPSAYVRPVTWLEGTFLDSTPGSHVDYFREQVSPDNTPPFVDRNDPVCGSSGVDIHSNVEFHLNDLISGIDIATVTVEIDLGGGYQQIWQGAPGGGSNPNPGLGLMTMSVESGSIGTTVYDQLFTFDPAVDFNLSTTIRIRVNADDNAANSLVNDICQFTTSAFTGSPTILNLNPTKCASKVEPVSGSASFDILDSASSLVLNTLQVTVFEKAYHGATTTYNVIVNGAVVPATGWETNTVITPISQGYNVTLVKNGDDLDEKSRYTIEVTMDNSDPVTVQDKWFFWTHWDDGYDYDIYLDSLNGSDGNTGADWDNTFATMDFAIEHLHPGRTLHIDTGVGYEIPLGNSYQAGTTNWTNNGWIITGHHGGQDNINPTRITTRENAIVSFKNDTPNNVSGQCAFFMYWAHNIEFKPTGYGRFNIWSGYIFRRLLCQNMWLEGFWANCNEGFTDDRNY